MRRLSSLFSAVLVALLVLTSQQHAIMRHADVAVGVMEFCIDDVAVVVPVDATGAPVERSHDCPDCTLHLLATLPAPVAQILAGRPRLAVHASAQASLWHGRTDPTRPARGPPLTA